MNQEEINKRTLEIALFMSEEPEVLARDLKRAGTLESMQYNSSWDWLMPVVEKIERICKQESKMYNEYFYSIRQKEDFLVFRLSLLNLFISVSDFCEWYKLNKGE